MYIYIFPIGHSLYIPSSAQWTHLRRSSQECHANRRSIPGRKGPVPGRMTIHYSLFAFIIHDYMKAESYIRRIGDKITT